MRADSISQHHIQLTQLGFVNAFLVREDNGFTLIDTCINQAGPILAAAAQLRLPVRRIALTHAHQDHASSVDALAALLPGVPLLASRRETRLLHGDLSLDAAEPKDKLRGSLVTVKTPVATQLEEGDFVGSLRVIAAPGHTPGQIAFLDERDGTLIAGDAWSNVAGLAPPSVTKFLFPFPALATWSRTLARVSAERLCRLKPTRLAMGHGKAIENPVTAMQAALNSR